MVKKILVLENMLKFFKISQSDSHKYLFQLFALNWFRNENTGLSGCIKKKKKKK